VALQENECIRLEVVAPPGPVFEGEVHMVVLPAATGEIGILPHHAPLVAQLAIGRLRVLTCEGERLTFAIAEGFAKVQFNKVIVLADAAEEASRIDVERVEKAMARATSRLEMLRLGTVPEEEHVDPYREQMALKRARNRLRVAERSER
jgi:F-type H+-transporting ATPase subunit epsilon